MPLTHGGYAINAAELGAARFVAAVRFVHALFGFAMLFFFFFFFFLSPGRNGPMPRLSVGFLGLIGVILLGASGPASAGGLPSAVERCLGLRPNSGLPSVVERRYGLRPNQPLPSAVEQDILRRCRYGYRSDPYSRHDRYDRSGRYDRYDPFDRYDGSRRPRYRPSYGYEYY